MSSDGEKLLECWNMPTERFFFFKRRCKELVMDRPQSTKALRTIYACTLYRVDFVYDINILKTVGLLIDTSSVLFTRLISFFIFFLYFLQNQVRGLCNIRWIKSKKKKKKKKQKTLNKNRWLGILTYLGILL